MTDSAKDAERLAGLRRVLGGGYTIELRPALADALKIIDELTQERGRSTQPTTDDVERARALLADENHGFGPKARGIDVVAKCVAAALTAARREDAELRALDEAVIVAARVVVDNTPIGRFTYLRDALAARDAASRALAARPRDAAPTEESDAG